MAARRSSGAATTADARVAMLAARRHGVVSRAELLALGLSDSAIRRRVSAGRLHPVFRQVFVVGSPDLVAEGREWAGLLASGPGAVLSHHTAAVRWGMRERRSRVVDVTTPTQRRSQPGLRMHRGALRAGDVGTRDGVALTSPERTLVDLADVLAPSALAHALACAERLGLVDRDTFEERAGRRRVVRGRHVFTRSGLERRFLRQLTAWRVPPPLVNQAIGRYEADFLWPDRRLVVELDAYATHGDRVAFERDRRKSSDLGDLGYRVRRITDTRLLADPESVRADLLRWLASPHGGE